MMVQFPQRVMVWQPLLEMVITNSATKIPSNPVFNITVRSMVLTIAKGKKG